MLKRKQNKQLIYAIQNNLFTSARASLIIRLKIIEIQSRSI